MGGCCCDCCLRLRQLSATSRVPDVVVGANRRLYYSLFVQVYREIVLGLLQKKKIFVVWNDSRSAPSGCQHCCSSGRPDHHLHRHPGVEEGSDFVPVRPGKFLELRKKKTPFWGKNDQFFLCVLITHGRKPILECYSRDSRFSRPKRNSLFKCARTFRNKYLFVYSNLWLHICEEIRERNNYYGNRMNDLVSALLLLINNLCVAAWIIYAHFFHVLLARKLQKKALEASCWIEML